MLATTIARRYLLARRATHAINIITGIAVAGIAIGTAALILVLSVFNGFEDVINGMYSRFNPDIKIEAAEGKTFEEDTTMLASLRALPEIAVLSRSLEEIAVFEYKAHKDFGTIKGVDSSFRAVTGLDSVVREGNYRLENEAGQSFALLGLGMRNKLAVNVDDVFTPITVYTPKRERRGPLDQPFRMQNAYPVGTFIVQQAIDQEYVVTSLAFVRRLLRQRNRLSSLEIKLRPGADSEQMQRRIEDLLGKDYKVRNRYRQEEAFLKLMQMEKWLSYAIVSLMMLMVAFNLVGALWMIVLEKRPSIAILKSMGATPRTIQSIFLQLGMLLSAAGMLIGMLLALGIYWLQKNIGLVQVPGDFAIDAYPMSLRLMDFVVVGLTVLLIGLLASYAPARRARKVPALIRQD